MQVAHINTTGLAQIADAMAKNHKLGGEHFTPAMLAAWAADAEDSFANGNGCAFEIRPFDSNTGRPVVVVISTAGFDVEIVDVE